MRTTVVLKDDLVKKAKRLSPDTTINGLLNICLAEWIARQSGREPKSRLVTEYRSACQEVKLRGSMKLVGDLDQALNELRQERAKSLERLVSGLK